MAKNADCAISDSTLCKWIDKDCAGCQMQGVKHKDDVQKALSDFEVMLSLLPQDFDELQGDECQFCKQQPNKRLRYALVDLGNSEPKSETGMFFGLGKKIRRKIGSLMPLSISICAECRRAFLIADLIRWIAAIVFLAASIAVLTIIGAGSTLSQEISLLIVAASTIVGYFAGRAISAAYVNAKSDRIRFNIFEIPICEKMQESGWFTLQDDGRVTRLLFSRKPHTRKIADLKGAKEAGESPV